MADDTWTIIKNRMTAMSELNIRQDKTAELLYWDDNPYKLVKPDGKTELRDSISVTPNLPKVFAHGVIADLLSGKWQTKIEGNISSTQAHTVETFVDDNFAQADEFLLDNYGMPSLFGWLCNHVCVRWAIGVRWISQVIDGEYNIDCLPVDMRWTPFVLNKWVAPITFWKKEDFEVKLEEYAKRAERGLGEYFRTTLDTDNEVRDFWNNEKNEVLINHKLVYAQKHNFGKPPFAIAIPASGFMLRDKGYLKHEGEDILFPTSGLYKELARSVSLEQTSGYAGLYPAYEKEVKDEHWDGKPSEPPPELDSSQDVRAGERHQPVPRGDINRAGQTARVDILEMISNGAPLSPRQYNTPPSAVLLAGEQEMISRLQNTRKDALGVLRSQLARLMIDQFLKAKGEVSVGQRGKKSKYSATKLGNPDNYTVSYHLSVKSKRQELANLAEFVAAYDKLPLEWNLTNILMADDPAGIINDLKLQEAKRLNPAIDLLEMAVKYAQVANDTEDEIESELKKQQSKILLHEYVMAMRQRTTQVPEKPKGDGQLLNQLGGAAGAMRGESVKPPEGVVE